MRNCWGVQSGAAAPPLREESAEVGGASVADASLGRSSRYYEEGESVSMSLMVTSSLLALGVCQRTKRVPGVPEGPGENRRGPGQRRLAAHGGHWQMAPGQQSSRARRLTMQRAGGTTSSGVTDCLVSLQNGTLKITDRKKHIFKLAQGEYIAPEKIETVYALSDPVAQIFVHGESLQV